MRLEASSVRNPSLPEGGTGPGIGLGIAQRQAAHMGACGKRRVDPEQRLIRFGRFTFDIERQQLTDDGEPIHLTTAELSLLSILARQPGTPVDRRSLSQQSRISGSDRAVDTQIARLRRKLETDPRRPQYLLTMRGAGYVLRTGG